MPWPSMALIVRGTLPADRVTALVRAAVRAVDPTVPVPSARPLEDVVTNATGQPRFRAWLVGAFAASAVLLAMVGLYGTIAFSVQQRTREIGLRMALGASTADVTRAVLSPGVILAVAGVATGMVAAAVITRLLSAMLFGVATIDPRTFVIAPVVILALAAFACYAPARRVRRIEPLRALSGD
jgi:putative ABC transport system permease protein